MDRTFAEVGVWRILLRRPNPGLFGMYFSELFDQFCALVYTFPANVYILLRRRNELLDF